MTTAIANGRTVNPAAKPNQARPQITDDGNAAGLTLADVRALLDEMERSGMASKLGITTEAVAEVMAAADRSAAYKVLQWMGYEMTDDTEEKASEINGYL